MKTHTAADALEATRELEVDLDLLEVMMIAGLSGLRYSRKALETASFQCYVQAKEKYEAKLTAVAETATKRAKYGIGMSRAMRSAGFASEVAIQRVIAAANRDQRLAAMLTTLLTTLALDTGNSLLETQVKGLIAEWQLARVYV